ncbi:MAG: RNA 2',3'-cyclic phosphodiesterase [Clostridia bacterium]
MRLFIALKLPEQTVNNLVKMQDQLAPYKSKGNFIPRQNLHITIKFLGEIYADKLYSLYSLLDSVKDYLATTLSIQQVSTLKGANIVIAKLKCDQNLLTLERYLTNKLEELQFTIEHRSYNPHITLIRQYAFELPFSEVVKNITIYNKPFVADELTLYSTQFNASGLVAYNPIYSVKLKIEN